MTKSNENSLAGGGVILYQQYSACQNLGAGTGRKKGMLWVCVFATGLKVGYFANLEKKNSCTLAAMVF